MPLLGAVPQGSAKQLRVLRACRIQAHLTCCGEMSALKGDPEIEISAGEGGV